jgi:hypothetical protein
VHIAPQGDLLNATSRCQTFTDNFLIQSSCCGVEVSLRERHSKQTPFMPKTTAIIDLIVAAQNQQSVSNQSLILNQS